MLNRIRSRTLGVLAISANVMCVHPSFAFTVGKFSEVCRAANWKTGRIEVVREVNVDAIPGGYHAYTDALPDGRYQIRWNVLLMRETFPIVQQFLFYHECAHAQLQSSDEEAVDCEALRRMRAELSLTRGHVRKIADAYERIGREFPPASCAH